MRDSLEDFLFELGLSKPLQKMTTIIGIHLILHRGGALLLVAKAMFFIGLYHTAIGDIESE